MFEQLDKNHDKRISFKEFTRGHELIGIKTIGITKLRELFDKIDLDKGGMIIFEEFCIYMAKQKLYQLKK